MRNTGLILLFSLVTSNAWGQRYFAPREIRELVDPKKCITREQLGSYVAPKRICYPDMERAPGLTREELDAIPGKVLRALGEGRSWSELLAGAYKLQQLEDSK